MPLQLRFLRALSFLLFAISLMALVLANVVTFAPRTIQVMNKEGNLIGRGIIPHDYNGSAFWTLLFAIFCGLQFWTILVVIRYRNEPKDKS